MIDYPPILVEKIFPDAKLPERAHPTDSGLDVFVYQIEKRFFENFVDDQIEPLETPVSTTVIRHQERLLVNTGIKVTVGFGYEIQVRPRSGLALKFGLTVLNTPGTIDESYRGMVGIILVNLSGIDQIIKKGDKIAQLVVCPVCLSEVKLVEKLPDTKRGENGFGSTGV
jgi:dUTP pyrophosphatase